MLRTAVTVTLLLFLLFPGLSQAQTEQTVAFMNVSVIPMDYERTLERHTVLVRDGRIASVGPTDEVDIPAGALRVDGQGKYLIPGLAEMHGHIPSMDASPEYVESVLFLFVANGITTVRGMQGAPGQLELRAKANRGEIIAPTLYLAGPPFSGGTINSPEDAAERVRRQKAEGWDLLKVLPGLTRAEYDAMARTAHEVGIDFAGHVPSEVGVPHAIAMGQATFDHIDGYIDYLQGYKGPVSQAQLEDIARRTRDAGIGIVPTMALWETLMGVADLAALRSFPELRYMPPDQVVSWTSAHDRRVNSPEFDRSIAQHIIDNRTRILSALHKAGVRILMGTDAPQQFSVPGFSLHRELQRMAEAGMTPYEILQSGTINVGAYFKDKDHFGTITPGMRADLVLLNAPPLEDIAHVSEIAGVMVRGRWLSAVEIQRRLDEIASRYDQARP